MKGAAPRADEAERHEAVPRGEREAQGWHWRLETPHGPVHLWIPERYDSLTAGFVIYVHGFYTTVDEAWRAHALAWQFSQSRKNALFIACEAPQGGDEQPFWDSMAALADTATRFFAQTGYSVPQVPHVVVMGHSGAYRTILLWLEEPIAHIILVDALYGNEKDFATWIDGAEETPDGDFTRQLTIVAWDTLRWSEPFVDLFGDVMMVPRIPEKPDAFTEEQRRARLLYIPSQYGHMEVVTEGRTLPFLLQQTRLTDVKGKSRVNGRR